MPTLARALLDRVRGPLAEELAALPSLEARLSALAGAGLAAHPDLELRPDAWLEHLALHLTPGDAAQHLEALRAADVHLVLSCLAGSPRALARFDERLRGAVVPALAGIRRGSLSVDELVQDVRARLLVRDGGACRLASYSGRGALDAWLRVTLARAALNAIRDRGRASERLAPSDGHMLAATLAASDDPQLALLRARCAPVLASCVREALRSLSESDRVLLKLSVVDGLDLDELAVVYGVHRATAARRLARVRTRIFERARREAMAALGVGEREFGSLIGAMMSQIDVTLRTLGAGAADRKE